MVNWVFSENILPELKKCMNFSFIPLNEICVRDTMSKKVSRDVSTSPLVQLCLYRRHHIGNASFILPTVGVLPTVHREIYSRWQVLDERTPRSGTRRCKNTKLRQVRVARRVIPYALCGGLYCIWCRIILWSYFEMIPVPPCISGRSGLQKY
jgi:hypothetical protein